MEVFRTGEPLVFQGERERERERARERERESTCKDCYESFGGIGGAVLRNSGCMTLYNHIKIGGGQV